MDETRDTPHRLQQPLPFDDESDHPVPYALTARARRTVAPQDVPDLTVVGPSDGPAPDPGSLDAPDDTRPSRARALRRAGMTVGVIARTLQVDELAVRAWLGDLAGRAGPGHPGALVGAEQPQVSATAGAFERAYAQARETGPGHLERDPSFAAGLGLLSGVADVDAHSVGVRTDDARVAAAAVRWLLRYTPASSVRVRVVLRLPPAAAADLARHRWAQALDLPVEQVAHTRSRDLPDGAEQALIRIADPEVAGAVSGWARALLEPTAPEPVDAAF